LYPNFTQEEFDKEKAKLLEGIKAQEKNVTAIANRVVNALAFGMKHPAENTQR
jgi:predicted Zn-dependent peptidase